VTGIQEPRDHDGRALRRFVPGEVVDVHIDQAQVVTCAPHDGEAEHLVLEFRSGVRVTVDASATWVRINRRVPADGMPRPGEIWEDRLGGRWFVIADGGSDTVNFVSAERSVRTQRLSDMLADYGPLRRIWSGEPTAESAADTLGGGAA
jgi:hypothetical protein